MAGQQSFRKIRKFGPFTLDPQTGEITRNGLRIRLQPQPARILILLTDVPGKLVTREDIRIGIWGADTVTDLEQSLNFAIRQIRAVLRDAADKPEYLETISKRGYRFIAPVSEISADEKIKPAAQLQSSGQAETQGIESLPLTAVDIAAEGQSTTSVSAGQRNGSLSNSPRGKFRASPAVFFILAGICLLSIFLLYHYKERAQGLQADSIVVLPFVNLTGDSSLEYLSDGMTEEMITRLAKLDPSHLKVIARTSAMSYKNTHATAQQIGNDLGVQYVMEGSLQKNGDQIRMIAQLIRVSDQMHIWAQSYDGRLGQLLTFENQVAQSIAKLLSLHFADSSTEEHTPINSVAKNEYLQGMYFLSQRSKQGFENALLHFGRAVQEDPKYARAYAQLAVTYNLMGQYNWMRQDEARSQAKAAAMQALSMDDSLSEAHAALGFSEWFYDWNPVLAEKELLRAIALDANNVDAHHWYSQLLMTSGRVDESERQMHAALALDPKALILQTNLGWIHYTARQYPLAIAEMKQVLAQNPAFLTAHYKLWWIYSVIHDEPRAWQEFQIVVHSVSSPEQAARILAAYNTGGYIGSLRALSGSDDSNYYGNYVDAARCMIFSGDGNGALNVLDKGLQMHDGWMIYIPTDPAFDSLHSDPAYIRFVDRLSSTSVDAATRPPKNPDTTLTDAQPR